MNRVILIGNLTKDPEVTTTTNGVEVCRFTLAINRPYKDANGNEQTDFINVVVWRNQAVNCGKYLAKGRQCAVVGSMQTRSYDKDGEKRYITEVVADNVEFLRNGGGNGNNGGDFVKSEKIEDLQPIETPFDDGKLPF